MNDDLFTTEGRLNLRYVRRLVPDEGGGYTASIHEFPGCIAEGDTADEALANLDQAALAWIAAARESGYRVCEPLDFEGASGKIALRISKRMHQQAAERAELEGTSLNQLIAVAIASYLGQQDGVSRCLDAVRNEMADGSRPGQYRLAAVVEDAPGGRIATHRKKTGGS